MNNFEYKESNKQVVVSVGWEYKAANIDELDKNYKPKYKDEVIIVKTITLNDKDFKQFTNNLLDDYNFIKDNELYYKVETDPDYNRLDRVLLITSKNVDYGIIVDTQGYSYARYTAYYKPTKLQLAEILVDYLKELQDE